VLLACSVLWIAFGQGAARAAQGSAVAAPPRCPSTTPPRSIPLEKLTIENATDTAPIAGLGHTASYRHKTLTSGLQLAGSGSSASGTFLLNRHYSHLEGIVYEDDANIPSGSIIVRDASTDNTVYQHDFIGAHDRVSFDIDVHGLTSITLETQASLTPATLDVVARLTP